MVASGISPSGPIHLGNLREIMTPHLVADEIRRRGRAVVHLLSWDDYDRFRKVPFGIPGVDPSWNEHIGRPLTAIPAPPGSPYSSWAEHFKAPMIEAMARMGIEVHQLSQTEKYQAGDYRDQILLAMRERGRIDAVLGRYRTKKATAAVEGGADEEDEDTRAVIEFRNQISRVTGKTLEETLQMANRSRVKPVSVYSKAIFQELITGTSDCQEGLAAFAERRTPQFRGW